MAAVGLGRRRDAFRLPAGRGRSASIGLRTRRVRHHRHRAAGGSAGTTSASTGHRRGDLPGSSGQATPWSIHDRGAQSPRPPAARRWSPGHGSVGVVFTRHVFDEAALGAPAAESSPPESPPAKAVVGVCRRRPPSRPSLRGTTSSVRPGSAGCRGRSPPSWRRLPFPLRRRRVHRRGAASQRSSAA